MSRQDTMNAIQRSYHLFRDDPRRARSPEVDFGVHWHECGPFHSGNPRWRVSWISDTGELYGVESVPDYPGRRYVLLGIFGTREEVENYMRGWAEKPMRLGPLANLVGRG